MRDENQLGCIHDGDRTFRIRRAKPGVAEDAIEITLQPDAAAAPVLVATARTTIAACLAIAHLMEIDLALDLAGKLASEITRALEIEQLERMTDNGTRH